jgi:endonuclease-3
MGGNLDFDIDAVMELLEKAVADWDTPSVTMISKIEKDPFKVLVSCILSLRTKDTTTGPASARLFSRADTVEKMILLGSDEIEKAIYPVGFYRTKATQIVDICKTIVAEYGGVVPDSIEELLTFKGVGRKTANLVVTLGYGKPGICVDTHVHRICNRWGYIKTGSPEESEMQLRDILPLRYWIRINDLLVSYGQNICKPVSPFCSKCVIHSYCRRINVHRYR